MTDEEKEKYRGGLIATCKTYPDVYDTVSKEEIAEFEDIMRKIITGIISEASGIATWVYVQKCFSTGWD